jgi:hypothetical protein
MGYGIKDQNTEVRFQLEAQIFSSLCNHTTTNAHSDSYATSNGGDFSGGKAEGTRRYPLPFSAKG